MNGIRFSFPDATLPIILVWYKSSDLATEVGRSGTFAPSATGYTYAPPNLEAVTYTFFFYETPDGGTTLQTLRAKWAIDGSALLRTAFALYNYVVGRGTVITRPVGMISVPVWSDPAAGDTELYDTRLNGETYVVFSRGLGPLREDEYTDTGNGFTLSTPGQTFSDGDTISVLVSKSSAVPSSGSGSETYHEVTDSDTLTSDYHNTHNIAAFTGALNTTTFPAFATIPDGVVMEFSTYACPAMQYWTLQFAGSDTVTFMSQNRNRITLRRNERIKLWFKSNGTDIICRVTKYDGRLALVGQVFLSDTPNIPGTILADGSEYDISDFAPLLEELSYGLPERLISSTPTATKFDEFVDKRIGGEWQATSSGIVPILNTGKLVRYYPNRGKFILDNSPNQKLRVPDERGQSFRVLKDYGGTPDPDRMTQGAGGRQAQELVYHEHYLDHGRCGSIDNNASGGGWANPGLNGIQEPNLVRPTGGGEQRVDNTGKYALIYI